MIHPAPNPIASLIVTIIAVSLSLCSSYICLVDIFRPERRVRGGDKQRWAVIVVFGSVIGQLLYWYQGKEN
ncbi:MAG: hypothetical protein H0X24_03830 [Ktedonobacterales bacterium]|nr:hypothetical protein [Ktedonobacterales bacterium]